MNGQEAAFNTQCRSFSRAHGRPELLDANFINEFNAFVSQNLHALEWRNQNGRTLLKELYLSLRWAIRTKKPLARYRDLVTHNPQVLAETNEYRLTLLHYACIFNPTAVDIIRFLLEQYPDAARALCTSNRTPLHFACYNNVSLQVVRLLVEAHPQAVQVTDVDGNTPLRYACSHAPLDVIQYLVAQQPWVCLLQNNRGGDLPLDQAKACNRDDDIITFMTTATSAAANVLTGALRCVHNEPPREIFGHVALFIHNGPEEIAMLKLAFRWDYIHELLQRDDIRAEIRARVLAVIAAEATQQEDAS